MSYTCPSCGLVSHDVTRRTAFDDAKLSARELQIIRLLMLGRTNKQIAASLFLSDKTVKHYMTMVLQKLNARNRLEAVIAAQKMGVEQNGMRS